VRSLLLCLTLVAGSVAYGEEPTTCSEMPAAMVVLPMPATTVTVPTDLGVGPTGAEPVSKRLFGIIPNYKADQYQEHYTPISTAGKFAIARSDSFDWPNYFLLAGYALQSQVASGGFGHSGGLNGFGRFYSRSVADQIIGSYVTEAILPTLFHEDPRFFRLGKGPLVYRAFNATTRVFVVKKDDGRTGIYYSELFGNLGVTAISSVYYPDSRSVSEGLERYGMAIGNDMISNLLTEFWPDIRRKLPFHHQS
jgi:hypothetical protein